MLRLTRRKVLAVAVLAMAALQLSVAAGAQPRGTTSGSCAPSKVKFSTNTADRRTTSRLYVRVPNSGVLFTQGGVSPGCVIVEFTALAAAGFSDLHGAAMVLQARIDDLASGLPVETTFTSLSNFATYTATFIFPSVVPGPHSVTIHFLSVPFLPPPPPTQVQIRASNTIVHFSQ